MRKPPKPGAPPEEEPPGGRARQRAQHFAQSRGLPLPPAADQAEPAPPVHVPEATPPPPVELPVTGKSPRPRKR